MLQLRLRMKLIIGLGNSGKEYVNTRHNTGFLVADALIAQISRSKSQISNKAQVLIFKSKNFMNDSGSFVKNLVDKYSLNLSDLYIIHDDLDIPLGSYKIQFGRGPKDHNGLKSTDDKLGTSAYWHVRVGIDNRPPFDRPFGEEYVLQNFTDDERRILEKVLKGLCKKLATL